MEWLILIVSKMFKSIVRRFSRAGKRFLMISKIVVVYSMLNFLLIVIVMGLHHALSSPWVSFAFTLIL